MGGLGDVGGMGGLGDAAGMSGLDLSWLNETCAAVAEREYSERWLTDPALTRRSFSWMLFEDQALFEEDAYQAQVEDPARDACASASASNLEPSLRRVPARSCRSTWRPSGAT